MSKVNGTKHHHKKPLASAGTVFAPIVGPTDELRSFADDTYNGIIIQESTAVVRTAIREYMSDNFVFTYVCSVPQSGNESLLTTSRI